MKQKRNVWFGLIYAVCMCVLILDSKTALYSAKDGIDLCIRVVIPSLFPLFVVSLLLNNYLTGFNCGALQILGKLCGIPAGSESILLLGLLGGYPVGAQCVTEAYRNGSLSKEDAQRMLGFCNNAGPAFIFGMLGSLFERSYVIWILWGIHMFSAVLTGCILPRNTPTSCILKQNRTITLSDAVEKSIKNIALVCSWVIIFRIIAGFLGRWFLFLLPRELQAILIGLLELTNGAYRLGTLANTGVRFICSALFLGFGGICVGMQTLSATKELGIGLYFPGKILQTLISLLLAITAQHLLFPKNQIWHFPGFIPIITALLCVVVTYSLFFKKSSRILKYNAV